MPEYLRTITVPAGEVWDTLSPYPGNPRVHSPVILDLVKAHGQYRSVFARELPGSGLQLLGGHGTTEALVEAGLPVRVEVYGSVDDTQAREIVLADNRANDLAGYDDSALLKLLAEADSAQGLAATGWDVDSYRELLDAAKEEGNPFDWKEDGEGDEGDEKYTSAINVPQYEVVGPCPDLSELVDDSKAEDLRTRIWEAKIPGDVRDYLIAAAGRHTVFNYRKAAEFYPHATPEVQALMEESALVVIDVDDAIRLGYAKLMETVTALREKDSGAE